MAVLPQLQQEQVEQDEAAAAAALIPLMGLMESRQSAATERMGPKLAATADSGSQKDSNWRLKLQKEKGLLLYITKHGRDEATFFVLTR